MYEPMPLSADASSSAPITTIRPIDAEMRMPVKMNGAALGRLMRRRMARRFRPKQRAVWTAIGSTSWTP